MPSSQRHPLRNASSLHGVRRQAATADACASRHLTEGLGHEEEALQGACACTCPCTCPCPCTCAYTRDLATRRRPFKVPRPDPTCFTITHPTSHIAYPTSHIGSHMVGVLGSACACACTCPCTYIFTCRAHAPGQSPSLYPVPPPTVAMRVHAQGSGQPTVHIASCMGAAHARLQAQPDLGARVLIKTRSGSSSPDLEGDRLRACSLPEPRLPNAPRHEEREVRSRTYTRGTGGAVGVHRVVVPSL